MLDEFEAAEKVAAASVVGFAGIAWYVRRMLTGFAQEGASESRAKAEMELIDNLRKELKRLSEQNDMLVTSVDAVREAAAALQGEVAFLRHENAELRRENAELRVEVSKLRVEVSRLTKQ